MSLQRSPYKLAMDAQYPLTPTSRSHTLRPLRASLPGDLHLCEDHPLLDVPLQGPQGQVPDHWWRPGWGDPKFSGFCFLGFSCWAQGGWAGTLTPPKVWRTEAQKGALDTRCLQDHRDSYSRSRGIANFTDVAVQTLVACSGQLPGGVDLEWALPGHLTSLSPGIKVLQDIPHQEDQEVAFNHPSQALPDSEATFTGLIKALQMFADQIKASEHKCPLSFRHCGAVLPHTLTGHKKLTTPKPMPDS